MPSRRRDSVDPRLSDRYFGAGGGPAFWDHYDRGLHRLAHASSTGTFADVFGLDHLESYLFAVRPRFDRDEIKLIRQRTPEPGEEVDDPQQLNQRPVTPERLDDILRAYVAGYSVVLNAVHTRWAAVAALNAEVMEIFGTSANASLYLTPPGSAAFPVHFDAMHVLIVQLQGRKHWRLYPDHGPDVPIERARVPKEELGRPTELTLDAGDVLYVPPGLRHDAYTTDDHSCHVTFGIHPPLESELLIELLRDPGRLLERRVGAGSDVEDWPRQETLLAVVDGALCGDARTSLTSAITAVHARECERSSPLPSAYLATLLGLEHLTPSSWLRRRPGLRTALRPKSDGSLVLLSASSPLVLPRVLEPALSFCLRGTPFEVRTMPTLTPAAAIRLARMLVEHGLLESISRPTNQVAVQ